MNPLIAISAIMLVSTSVIGGYYTFVNDPTFTRAELNACAAEAELNWYIKTSHGNKQDAINSMALDADYQDIIGEEAKYQARFHLDTMFTGFIKDGRAICAEHKRKGEPIRMIELHVQKGWHIVRDIDGSAMLVKDGESAYPDANGICNNSSGACIVPGCANGFHESGIPYDVANPNSGCVRD